MDKQLQNIFDDKPLLEKFMLAWHLSTPSDAPTAPHKIKISRIDDKGELHYEKLNSKGVMYGMGTTSFQELERYYKSIESMLDAEKEIFEHTTNEEESK